MGARSQKAHYLLHEWGRIDILFGFLFDAG
jgi:hypothetical protein